MPTIITVDGPASAGKGTLARKLALHFDYAFLDTGLLYRAIALKALKKSLSLDAQYIIEILVQPLSAEELEDPNLRNEEVGKAASILASLPEVRSHLLAFQRNFAKSPPHGKTGAVLDGRDIGTVVLPDANFKLFITASLETRAKRRFNELKEKGISVKFDDILTDMKERDLRDTTRAINPLQPATDAFIIDTTNKNSDEVFLKALAFIQQKKVGT